MNRKLLSLIAVLLIVFCTSSSQGQIISTYAGNGASGFTGDSIAATAAELHLPHNVATDDSGNVYVSDVLNHRIRKINSAGNIYTICGTGSAGSGGDGGQATAATINFPTGIVKDASGNIYFADYLVNKVRKISPSGIISTYAGTGSSGFSGDGSAATAATIKNPYGLALDGSGGLLIADYGNNRIRKVSTSGIISTIAGSGTTGGYSGDFGAATASLLNAPYGVAVDGSGFVYIADNGNNRIRKISASGIITTFCGTGTGGYSGDGGLATAALIASPTQVSFDRAGNLYVVSASAARVRVINTSGIINAFAGTGTSGFGGDGSPATVALISNAYDIAFDSANIGYLADAGNNRIRKILPYVNHVPYFLTGHAINLGVCINQPTSLNSLLAINDSEIGQMEYWSLLSAPTHGTAYVSYNAISTGGALLPSGLSYSPATGYVGLDTFTVRITDSVASDTAIVYVTVNAIPSAGVIDGNDSVCPGYSVTLSSSVTGGAWASTNSSIATVSSGGIATGLVPGIDTILYTIGNICKEDTARYPLMVQCPNAVDNVNVGNSVLNLYPNPVNAGNFMVQFNTPNMEKCPLTIRNIVGQIVYQAQVESGKANKLGFNAPAGVYFVSVKTNTGILDGKLIYDK